MLARRHDVVMLDIDERKVSQVNDRVSPLEEVGLTRYLATEPLALKATNALGRLSVTMPPRPSRVLTL